MLVWIALAVGFAGAVGAFAFAVVRWLRLWRALRASLRALGEAADDVVARLEAIGSHDPPDLDALDESVARLRRSRAQLAVLTNAIGRVREQASGALAVYPRK